MHVFLTNFLSDEPTSFAVAADPVASSSPRDVTKSVFAIFDTLENGGGPVGTCFAISDHYLLSCQHFMRGSAVNYRIAPVAEKNLGSITFTRGVRNVKVVKWDKRMDHAVLKLVDEPYDIEAFTISLDDIGFDTDLKVFHFPVVDFNRTESGLISPYATWLKSSLTSSHKVGCSGAGLFKGSSGAPYVMRNGKVVGIHVEGANDAEGVTFAEGSDVESRLNSLSESANSNSNAHGSISYALLISKCPKLVDFLNENGIA
jgi:S1-C subfamily serine protease